jgi:hypothetical protein
MDTVGVEGMTIDPFGAEIHDGRLYGRGAQDMKGSLAAMLAVAKAFVDGGVKLAGDLLITGVADEEYASLGAEHLVQHVKADAAIVTEPTELNLCRAHRGFIWFDVETFGRAAHGSQPVGGHGHDEPRLDDAHGTQEHKHYGDRYRVLQEPHLKFVAVQKLAFMLIIAICRLNAGRSPVKQNLWPQLNCRQLSIDWRRRILLLKPPSSQHSGENRLKSVLTLASWLHWNRPWQPA